MLTAFDYWSLIAAGSSCRALTERVDEIRPKWMRQAACRGAGVADFFPDPRAEHAPGQQLPARCCVIAECRAFALAVRMLGGVWAA